MIAYRNTIKMSTALLVAAFLLATPAMAASSVVDHETFILEPESSQKAPDENGFIQLWHILDPMTASRETQNAVRETVYAENFEGQLTVVPKDGDQVNVGNTQLTWHAVDTNKYNINLHYFASKYGKSPTGAMFWAVTTIVCPEEVVDARLAIGSNSASVWWVNGEEATGIYGNRQTVVDDGVSKRLTLKKGKNVIRGAIINASGAADFCVRILDSEGNPFKDFTITLESAE